MSKEPWQLQISLSLSYGDRRRLDIARGLATNPRFLFLDEPPAGTNPSEKRGLASLIRKVRDVRGVSILLIEHDMKLVMSLAERLYVLNFGSVIAEGSPEEIRASGTTVFLAEQNAATPFVSPTGLRHGERAHRFRR